MAALDDKNATMQVIGSLMKSPLLLVDNNYINEEENEYSIQFYELGDWDYECKNIKELKNILATYYIQKYDIETTDAIEKVNLIFDNI